MHYVSPSTLLQSTHKNGYGRLWMWKVELSRNIFSHDPLPSIGDPSSSPSSHKTTPLKLPEQNMGSSNRCKSHSQNSLANCGFDRFSIFWRSLKPKRRQQVLAAQGGDEIICNFHTRIHKSCQCRCEKKKFAIHTPIISSSCSFCVCVGAAHSEMLFRIQFFFKFIFASG